MRDAGGADLILTSPPYPDARKAEAYGAEFDTSLAGYQRLGDATFDALKPGGVCALNIDGPVRVWRPELGESERSLIAFEVALDWAKRVGFRYVEPAPMFATRYLSARGRGGVAGGNQSTFGGDLGIRQRDGARWADVINDGLRQGRLFG